MSKLMDFLLALGLSEPQAIGVAGIAGLSMSFWLHWKWGRWRRRRGGELSGQAANEDADGWAGGLTLAEGNPGGELSITTAAAPGVVTEVVTPRGRWRRTVFVLGLLGLGVGQAANVTTLVGGWSASFRGVSDEEGPPQGGWLTGAEVESIINSMVEMSLLGREYRPLLFSWGGWEGTRYMLHLPEKCSPFGVVRSDLGELNRGGRLSSGYLPLACYLEQVEALGTAHPQTDKVAQLRERLPECVGGLDAVAGWIGGFVDDKPPVPPSGCWPATRGGSR